MERISFFSVSCRYDLKDYGCNVVTVAMPVFWAGPTPPSTALTIRMYSDFSSRSSRAVVVISPETHMESHQKYFKQPGHPSEAKHVITKQLSCQDEFSSKSEFNSSTNKHIQVKILRRYCNSDLNKHKLPVIFMPRMN